METFDADPFYEDSFTKIERASGNDRITSCGLRSIVKFLTYSTREIEPLLSLTTQSRKKYDVDDWLTGGSDKFGASSKQGKVSKALLFNQRPVVLKKYGHNMFETAKREYLAGIAVGNVLNIMCPFFVFTMGAWKSTKHHCILTDMVRGKVLADVVKVCSHSDFLNIFAQILFALELSQKEFKFCHYDLHAKNIIITKRKDPTVCRLGFIDYVFNHKYNPVIIDFGMCRAETDFGNVSCPENLEKHGILKRLRVGYDAFTCLLFLYKEVTDKTLIMKLLSFFGTNMKLSSHVECLDQFTDDKTPGMMLDWMFKEFPNTLSILKRDSRTICFRFPEKWSFSQLLSRPVRGHFAVGDAGKEKSFARYLMVRHVNAQMGYFEKRDDKCKERVQYDLDSKNVEETQKLFLIVKYLNLDKTSKTYSTWCKKYESPQFYESSKHHSKLFEIKNFKQVYLELNDVRK